MLYQLPHYINKTPPAIYTERENQLTVAPNLLHPITEPKQMQASFRLLPTLYADVILSDLPPFQV